MRRVERQQVLAYRAYAQGLHRDTEAVDDLAVLDLGVQDTPPGSAAHALALRLRSPLPDGPTSPELATTWSVRGAPHVHRVEDLVPFSRALWPWSDGDALARLDTSSSPVRASGMSAREALGFVASQIADIVTAPMAKGEVSTALTPRIPPAMTVDCRRCEATHVVETLFRSAVLPAGIVFDRAQRVVTFVPVAGWPGVPEDTDGAERLVSAYLRGLGPATKADAAAFLGTKASEMSSLRLEGLAGIDMEGRRGWIPDDAVEALQAPPTPPAVRLLPPSDPLLQARDRDLMVPDRGQQKALWPILGRPGALLVHGDIAGVWRARKKSRRLDVEVQPFRRLSAAARRGVEEEAPLVARARGLADAAVRID